MIELNLFDSHCHLDGERFDEDREAVHQRMLEGGVSRYAVIGCDMPSSRRCVEYAAGHEGCYASVGIHPHDAKTWLDADAELLAAWSKEEKVVAIGEIGLDYYYDYSPRDVQIAVCEKQMDLAWELDMPVIYHVRDAHPDMLDVLKRHKGRLTGGVIHCFSGSWEIAKEYLKMGFHLGFDGPITFKNAPKLQEVVVNAPLDRIMVETDSPYLTPVPVRGKRNEPTYVRYVVEKIAELKGISLEEAAAATTKNAMDVYRIK